MRKIIKFLFCFFMLVFVLGLNLFSNFGLSKIQVYAETDSGTEVYLGGFSVGFDIISEGAKISNVIDIVSKDKISSPAKESGLKINDIIISIDGVKVNSAYDIEQNVKDGKTKLLKINRNGEIVLTEITPVLDISNKYRLGLIIKDGIKGVGTASFIYNDIIYTLGHPVIDANNMINVCGGEMYQCDIVNVKKGVKNNPGELIGVFNKAKVIASIIENRRTGVVGKINDDYSLENNKKIKTGEGKIGSAYIYSTVSRDTPKLYKIQIVKVDNSNPLNKNYVIKVIDKELINITGGIVQGMSGSPIIQDNKLIGAVTHVFINDPQVGYGISVDKMLNNQ